MNNPVCYKYRTAAAALRSLAEGTVYFAAAAELNDSLEAKFDGATLKEFARETNFALLKLARARGYIGPDFGDRVSDELASVSQDENKRFYATCQRTGICSTSERPDNQPMWSYYCDNDRGVCFQFEWSENLLKEYGLHISPVSYTRRARVHNRAEDYRECLLELGDDNPDWSMEQIAAFTLTDDFRRKVGVRAVARAICVKHADWEHEREVRILAPRSGPLPVLKDILKRVIIGRTDYPEWSAIMKLIYQLYPDTKLSFIRFSHTEPYVDIQDTYFKKVPIEKDENFRGLYLEK